MSGVDPICVSECEDIAWFERATATKAQARRFCEDMWGRFDLQVRQGHIRSLAQADCPAHPTESHIGTVAWDEDETPEDCRCGEIEEGWFDSCSHREPAAIACWRVEPTTDNPNNKGRQDDD